MENRKFIQALFDQSVFDSLFPDNVTIGNEEVTSSTDFISKSLTPDLLPLPTQDTIKVWKLKFVFHCLLIGKVIYNTYRT